MNGGLGHPDDTADLATLARHADAARWSVDSGIDWSCSPGPPRWWTRRGFVRAVSQLYHGECITGEFVRRLAAAGGDEDVVAFLEVQAEDERRHAQAYRRYLDRLGDIAGIDAPLADLFAAIAAWSGPRQAQMVAYHLVVEDEAVQIQNAFSRWVACPLLRSVHRRVATDEARHVAFGRLVLRRQRATLSGDEWRHVVDWIEDLWLRHVPALASCYVPSLPGRFRQNWIDSRWRRHRRAIEAVAEAA